jgi:alginate O-acetyltransferase complex protein AlgI
MLFNSLSFLFVFFPAFLAIYYLLRSNKQRNILILVFSLFFYSWGEPRNIIIMIIVILLSFASAILIDSRRKQGKIFLIFYLMITIGIFVNFKYTDFIIENINQLFKADIHLRNIGLPIGISFYSFQCISYVIDVYWQKLKADHDLLDFACYVSLFPQLIAGPIVRYQSVSEQLKQRKVNARDFEEGMIRFIIGLGKKVIIANNVAVIADTIFDHVNGSLPLTVAWIGAIAYFLQIYYDFSAYSDMAIAIGRMLGFYFPENFDRPYVSKSITEFWRRWHISLGSWFRDYVYIPLGGNRVSKVRWILNIMIVWSLTGLWHGASWNFVIWGIFYGLILITERLFTGKLLEKHPFIARVYSLLLIMLDWIIFRSNDLESLMVYVRSLFNLRSIGGISALFSYNIPQYLAFVLLGLLGCTPLLAKLKKAFEKYDHLFDIGLTVILIVCLIFIISDSYSPFIYFRF